jgi:hypothetical protein
MAYASTVNHAQLAARLRASRRPFLTTHFKPDGDALGSVLALGRALHEAGAPAHRLEASIDALSRSLGVPVSALPATPVPVAPSPRRSARRCRCAVCAALTR